MMKTKHNIGIGTLLFSMCLLNSSAWAADKELLDILLANGAINEEQYQDLLEKEELTADDVQDVTVEFNRSGLTVASSDESYEINIGARLQVEASTHDYDSRIGFEPTNGTEIRRARIELSGVISKNWTYAAEVDFADNLTAVKDFWMGYETEGNLTLAIGHQKQPYSLDVEMSSNDIPFIERSVDAYLLAPFVDRAIGVRADTNGDNWFVAAGIFGESMDPNAQGNEGWGTAGRIVYAPIMTDDSVLHLGVRGAFREQANENLLGLRIRDETTHFSNLRIVNTGFMQDIKDTTLMGPEFAFAQGPFSVYGEYNTADMTRAANSDLSFDSWHMAATWSITGESRAAAYRINSGEFKTLVPASNFDEGGTGAWELAFRLSSIDLNDREITGGSEKVISTAVNWYVNRNVRFMFDWTHILETDKSNQVRQFAEGMDIFQARAQWNF